MSKVVQKTLDGLRRGWNLTQKFMANHTPGSRIVPSRTSRNDAKHQIRFDAGELIDDQYLNVNVQVNGEATSKPFKDFIKAYGTHANLATAQFDTRAADPEAETDRFMDDVREQMLAKLK